eukprot:TRINITY_DN449_c0_g3_i1.p1 TRINITY_DN449_c0_g3~~TRINITY_DN449_c0_g3_i1.p1  ORF type:complete len:430 (+),score=140.87 TRINITY_DN449_c0_g3_i1:82-1371(+)
MGLPAALLAAAAGALSPGVLRPQSPPMGWRSWNFFECNINQSIMQAQVDGLLLKRAPPAGAGAGARAASLFELGYTHAGLDDCWQKCDGPHGSFHNASGQPIVDTAHFPDLKGLAAYGAQRGVLMGFYQDNCRCHETGLPTHYKQDAAFVEGLGFAGVKIDSCGNQRNMTEWAQLFAADGRELLVESCGNGPAGTEPKRDPSPHPEWVAMLRDACPFSFYRVSVDVAPQFHSTVYNANRAVPYLGDDPLSRPGCWAYPDMLEVGVRLTEAESRAHFSMWAVTSAPLILGLDLSNHKSVAAVWPVIANAEVIAVNQQWAGHPGRLVQNSSETFTAECKHGASDKRGDQCVLPKWQLWAKPQPGGAVAVLAVNVGEEPANVSAPLASLGITATSAAARDLWAHTANGTVQEFRAAGIPPHDCAFVLLTPAH